MVLAIRRTASSRLLHPNPGVSPLKSQTLECTCVGYSFDGIGSARVLMRLIIVCLGLCPGFHRKYAILAAMKSF